MSSGDGDKSQSQEVRLLQDKQHESELIRQRQERELELRRQEVGQQHQEMEAKQRELVEQLRENDRLRGIVDEMVRSECVILGRLRNHTAFSLRRSKCRNWRRRRPPLGSNWKSPSRTRRRRPPRRSPGSSRSCRPRRGS